MAQASKVKLQHTGPGEKERVSTVPQKEQLVRMSDFLLVKGKETELSVKLTRS